MPPLAIDVAAKPAKFISEYNLFLDAKRQIPNEGLIPYDLTTPLFSDYTSKHRFVYLPPGVAAQYNETDTFEFPVGAVIVKTFGYLNDLRDPSKGERIIETRLLVHKPEGWVGLPYLWDEETKDARLAVAGGRREMSWTHYDGETRNINYIIPNMNQCKHCHEIGGRLRPIGPSARYLNKDYPYDTGVENQLQHWTSAGALEGAPAESTNAPQAPVWDDPDSGSLESRARAYLDINCAHCHRPDGPAAVSGLDLSYLQEVPAKIGIMKAPVAAGRGSGGLLYGIVPGQPDKSILVHRIESTDPGVMMPQLPRQTVHDEGVALIREWIGALPVAG
jgi:uncharacterized repeat protein (TIGR03806 family)